MLKTIESKNSEQYIKELSRKNNEPEWLLNKRLGAYNIFKSMPMPNFIYGLNINMNIELDLDLIDVSKAAKSNLKIINNARKSSISGTKSVGNEKIIIEDFNGMLKNHESILRDKLMSIVDANEKFTAFHNAFLDNLTFVYVPKNTVAKEPIELASVVGSNAVFDHLIVLVEDNSKVTLVEDSKSNNEEYN